MVIIVRAIRRPIWKHVTPSTVPITKLGDEGNKRLIGVEAEDETPMLEHGLEDDNHRRRQIVGDVLISNFGKVED